MPKIRDPLDFSQYRRMPEEDDHSNANSSQTSGPTSNDAADNPFRHFNMTRSESVQRQY